VSEDFKAQRDRYIAFSLAAADLLIEIDASFRVVRMVGAAQSLLNENPDDLRGKEVGALFVANERALVRRLLERTRAVGRIEPCGVHLDPGEPLSVTLGACSLPGGDGHIYLTVTVQSDALLLNADARDPVSGLLDVRSYQAFVERALSHEAEKAPAELKMVRLQGLNGLVRALPSEQSDMLLGEIGAVLRAQSLGGAAAARLSDDSFSYMPSPKGEQATEASLSADIRAAAKAAGVVADGLRTSMMSLKLSVGNLDQDSVARALNYALTSYCKTEGRPISNLQQGLETAMAETVQHFDSIRNVIDSNEFTLFFQPVVSLEDRVTHHYEALMRFPDGRKPYDTIRLSEQLGLVHDFDLAVTQKALGALKHHPEVSVAINLSGLSVQSDTFREQLRQLVMPHRGIEQRLMFELTESNAVEDMEAASVFLKWLRRTGFAVCLDDFGAGAAAYSYLRNFDVDYVKIDGPFLKAAKENPRQRALIRSIAGLCKELNSHVIAEMIEDEEMAQMCAGLGITYGQGFLFGKPKPQFDAPREVMNGRRKGFTESWS
jgi:EAL domain-containing protein (putative c-di-GMP-specific phosphodiesterase class I)/GGDEF domain-containing protein